MTTPAQALAPGQAAYEAYQAVRWPYGEAGSTPWNHPALDKARPAWAAAAKAAIDASPDLATARNALSDLAELHLRTVEELAAVTAERDKARSDRNSARNAVCQLLDLFGAPDERLMQHASVTRATLLRYASESGVRLDGLPS